MAPQLTAQVPPQGQRLPFEPWGQSDEEKNITRNNSSKKGYSGQLARDMKKKTIFTTFFSPKIFKTSYKSSTSLKFPQRAHYQLQVVSPSEPTRHPPAPSLPSPIYCYLLYMRRCNLRFAVRGKAFS